jgi:hypothetical protein
MLGELQGLLLTATSYQLSYFRMFCVGLLALWLILDWRRQRI